ncbi:hypothetical protein [Microbaculum marinisediminis]|uniref:FUSC family protein n=2 Tax=Pseudomonadota TaxID=1224 RepID=A0AAW5R2Y2_9HYPH|nr:hypothetical protein [Microbaculum sp. A6E488]MCT8973018.1 hypothetical protein [Microbaculum sp. A6E488]
MAADVDERKGMGARLANRLRSMDPYGTYLRFTGYTCLIAGLAALGGFVLASPIATPHDAAFAGVFAALFTGFALMFARPDAETGSFRAILAIDIAVAGCAALGIAVAPYHGLAQALVIPIAFFGFYVRRWPEPLPSAGLLGTLGYVIVQVLAAHVSQGVLAAGLPPTLAGLAIGYRFLPRRAFRTGLARSVRRLRDEIPMVLRIHVRDAEQARATVRRINALLMDANSARLLADQFDPGRTQQHLDLLHTAAILARVWENAADNLQETRRGGPKVPKAAITAIAAAEDAVAVAFDRPSPDADARAVTALGRLEATIAEAIDADGSTPDQAIFGPLNVKLTLSHLLEARRRLDAELAMGMPEPSEGLPA